MDKNFKNSIVQLSHIESGYPVGTGFAISEHHVVTCAHVIKDVFGLLENEELKVGSSLPLSFPLNKNIKKVNGKIIMLHNQLDKPDVNAIEDIAIIEIDDKFIKLSYGMIFLPENSYYYDDEFCTFGFSRRGGAWFDGKFSGSVGEGWVQLQIDNIGRDSLNGLSGAPVWNKKRNMIYGMLVAKQNNNLTAFMIPVDRIIEAWPDIEKVASIEKRHLTDINFLRDKLELIKAELFSIDDTKIPFVLVSEYNKLRSKIFEAEIVNRDSNNYGIEERAELCLISLESVSRELIRKNFSDAEIDEVNSWITTIEDGLDAYRRVSNDEVSCQKREKSLLSILRVSELLVRKNISLINYLDVHPVSSIVAFSYVNSPLNFVDREDAIKNLLYNFEKYNVLVISGMGGMGKTYLGQKLVTSISNKNLVWVNCNENMTLDQFVHSVIGCIAKEFKGDNLVKLLEISGGIDEERLSIIFGKIDKYNICLVFDDFHKVSQEIEKSVECLIKYSDKTKIIIITRLRTKFLRSIYFLSYTENLLGIDVHKMRDYLIRYQLDVSHDLAGKIYKKTDGHPLALRLLCSLCIVDRYDPEDILSIFSDEFSNSLNLNLLDQIKKDLSDSEISFMEEFSVIKQPIDRLGIGKIVSNPEYVVALNSLIHRFLISEPFEREFILHEFIREFFYESLDNKSEVHFRAAVYYEDMSASLDNVDFSIESFYHYFKAGMYDDASRILNDKIAVKLYQVYKLEQLNKMIDQLKCFLPEMNDNLYIYEAMILEVWGRWNESLDILKRILGKGGNNIGKENFLAALNSMLHIYDQKGMYNEGLELFNKYKNQISETNPTGELAHLYHRVGRFYHELGDFNKLSFFYDKSLSISKSIKDDFNYIRTSRLKGVSAWFFGNYDESLRILEPLVYMCRVSNNDRELSDTLKHIGIVYMKKGLYQEAVKPLNESISINERIGYKHGVAWSSMNLGDVYLYLNELEKANQLFKDAMNIFTNLCEKNGILNTSYRFGKLKFVKRDCQGAIDAYKESLLDAQQIGSPVWEGMVMEALYEVYDEIGDKDTSLEMLLNAEKIYANINSSRIKVVKKIIEEIKKVQ